MNTVRITTIRKYKEELKYAITEIKNIPEGSNSRIDDTEEWISELEDRRVEIKLNRKYKKEF